MPFLIQMVWMFLISQAARILATPDQTESDNAKAASLSDVDAPTINEGSSIPVVFGSVLTGRQNVTWYGGLSNTPITQQGVTTAYKYSLTAQNSLCFGPIDIIREIRFDDQLAWTAIDAVTESADYWDYNIDKPDLFGGEEKEGGLVGRLRVYKGTTTQDADVELNTLIGTETPAYRRVCHAVMRNMYVGTSARIKAPAFLVERCPKSLVEQWAAEGNGDFMSYQIHRIGSNRDANPVCAIYEALTDTIWGAQIPRSQFDTASWWDAAYAVKVEGLGVSTVLSSGETVDALVKRLQQYLDALIFEDPIDGLIQIQLVREQSTTGVVELTEANVSTVESNRVNWADLKTTTKVTFTDQARNYETGGVMAQNSALVAALGGAIDLETVDLPGFSNSYQALQVATRLSRSLSYPLSKVSITGDRSLAAVRPGIPFKLTWSRPPINAYFRASEVDLGSPADPFVKILAIEDIFTAATNTFTPPPGSGFENTGALAQPVTRITLIETPYHLRRFDSRSLIFGASSPSVSHTGYRSVVNGSTSDGATYGFMTSSAISAAIPAWDGVTLASVTISATVPSDVVTPTQGQYDAGESLLLIGNELLAYRTVTHNSNGTTTFGTVARAVLDTVPEAHPSGALCTVLATCRTRVNLDLGTDAAVTVAAQTLTLSNTQALAAATARTLTTGSRAVRPYPPAAVTLAGTLWGASGSFVSPTIAWEPRSRLGTAVLDQAATGVTAEAGTDYLLRRYSADGATLLETVVTTGPTATISAAGSFQVTLHSRRNGLQSAQGYRANITVLAATLSVPTTLAVTEGTNATADVVVTLNAAAPGTITVDYATSDGTATAGSDYTSTSGTLTYAPGQTSKTIQVPLTDDSAVEGTETFTLTLSNPSGAVLGNAACVVTIASDDTATGHRYWRLNVTALAAGAVGAFLEMSEIELKVGSTDVTTGRGAYASETGNHAVGSAAGAVDNDNGSYFGEGWTGNYFWTIDLGSVQALTSMTLRNDGFGNTYAAGAFTLQYSDDGTTGWTTALTQTGLTWATAETKTFTL